MGVINEYFVAASDDAAAQLLDAGPVDGVIGPDPGSELATLEALLMGLDPDSEAALALISRDDHALDIAHDADYSRMVIKIADGTTQLIANMTREELGPHLSRWACTDELVGTTAEDLEEMMCALHPLFVTAANNAGLRLYAWVSL